MLEEYFSHPAEQMHTILAEKEGPALQLCCGCSQHIPAHAAVGTSMSLSCSHPAEALRTTQGQQTMGLVGSPASPWFTDPSYSSRAMAKCLAT